MLFKTIPRNPKARRFAIGDVHGCVKTLQSLVLQKIRPGLDDQIFFLGDYIDRGPDSAGVLEFIIELSEQGYPVYALRGNHEQALLDSHTRNSQMKDIKNLNPLKSNGLFKPNGIKDVFGRILTPYLKFLEDLPFYFDLGDYYLVHAGINFNAEKPLEDWKSMLLMREMNIEGDKIPDNRKIVHGHSIRDLDDIHESIALKKRIIPLDNGCFKASKNTGVSQTGNLMALNLDTLELYAQPCMDFS